MWRLDTDSFLLGEAAADPFAQMEVPPSSPATWSCSLYHIRMQPLPHTVAASTTYGCSRHYIRLQAAGATYGWVHAFRDDPMFVTGLWETTAAYLKARNISQVS